MRHAFVAGIAALAVVLALGALLADWEAGPASSSTDLASTTMQEGRAATATDPARPDGEPAIAR